MPDARAPLPVDLEARLSAAAREFAYPPTPDLSRVVVARMSAIAEKAVPARQRRLRRWALVGVLLALLLAGILAAPPVRAAVLDWIRLGAVRIFLVPPTPAPTQPSGQATATPTPLGSVLDVSGETTLQKAQTQAGFTLRLPPGEGRPDRVYYQDLGGPVVILVWMDPARPGRVRLSLSETLGDGIMFQKIDPKTVEDTTVNGRPALWVDSPYLLVTGSGDTSMTRLVEDGHTLIWTEGNRTYRLETTLGLDEARRVAEGMK
jgi:hypothetical protein